MKHPVHPLIVHFPIACWSLSTLGDLLNFFGRTRRFEEIGALMLIGCVSAVMAMMTGIYEVTRIKPANQISIVIEHHVYAATTTLCFYSLSLFLRWDSGLSSRPDVWVITISSVGFLCLLITGWYGGHLVYKYGVGQMN